MPPVVGWRGSFDVLHRREAPEELAQYFAATSWVPELGLADFYEGLIDPVLGDEQARGDDVRSGPARGFLHRDGEPTHRVRVTK
jgi:hypothetical protein